MAYSPTLLPDTTVLAALILIESQSAVWSRVSDYLSGAGYMLLRPWCRVKVEKDLELKPHSSNSWDNCSTGWFQSIQYYATIEWIEENKDRIIGTDWKANPPLRSDTTADCPLWSCSTCYVVSPLSSFLSRTILLWFGILKRILRTRHDGDFSLPISSFFSFASVTIFLCLSFPWQFPFEA